MSIKVPKDIKCSEENNGGHLRQGNKIFILIKSNQNNKILCRGCFYSKTNKELSDYDLINEALLTREDNKGNLKVKNVKRLKINNY